MKPDRPVEFTLKVTDPHARCEPDVARSACISVLEAAGYNVVADSSDDEASFWHLYLRLNGVL